MMQANARGLALMPSVAAQRLAPRPQAAPVASRRRSFTRPQCRRSAMAAAALSEKGDRASGSADAYSAFETLLDTYDFKFRVGDKVSGTVFQVTNNGVWADIGAKSSAFCPVAECSLKQDAKASDVCKVGDHLEFVITKESDSTKDNIVLVSLRRIKLESTWDAVMQLQKSQEYFDVKITGNNRGGCMGDVMGIVAFLPSSHLPYTGGSFGKPEEYVGQTVSAKVLDVDAEEGKLVITARKERDKQEKATYKVGDVLTGVVDKIMPYGAFIKLPGNSNGLLHIGQITGAYGGRIDTVESVLAPGESIKVMVFRVETADGQSRMSLSTRHLEPKTGDMLNNKAAVFARAEEMAQKFLEKLAKAEAAARGLDAAAEPAAAATPAE